MKKKLAVIFIFTLVLLSFAGCGKKKGLTKHNSATLQLDSYSFTKYNKYTEASLSDEYHFSTNSYQSEKDQTILACVEEYCYCDLDAYVDYWQGLMAEGYKMDPANMVRENDTMPDGTPCIRLKWDFKEPSADCYGESLFARYENIAFLAIISGPKANEKQIASEFQDMMETLLYTSTGSLPLKEECPYTVSTEKFKIILNENQVCMEIEQYNGNKDYYIDGSKAQVRLMGVPNYDANMQTRFRIEYDFGDGKNALDSSLGVYETFSKPDGLFEDATYEELTMAQIWPDISDELKDVSAYRATGCAYTFDGIYEYTFFDYKGETYRVAIMYPKGMDDIKDSLYDLMYNVEFL